MTPRETRRSRVMVLIPSVRAAPFLSRASVASSGRLFGKPFVKGALCMGVVAADRHVSMVIINSWVSLGF